MTETTLVLTPIIGSQTPSVCEPAAPFALTCLATSSPRLR
jgi:hypothetical protein